MLYLSKIVAIGIVALILSVSSARPEDDTLKSECIAVETLSGVIAHNAQYYNLHIVDQKHFALAIEVYNATFNAKANGWDMALLLDHISGGGILIVGKNGEACRAVGISKPFWREIVRMLENNKI